ncbi:hypothetical protein DFP72DRAFT_827668 [Ephemerocybe angulata]|uniref:Fungal-type protein kinase domain-containing protein n=1 Tax=Ephemerocybe angulata TaxID=980116 RepID=A0A8H6HCT6_9AGAR|nr:hypothetical protein DFP72DRAFT_827668 [Tulosesus angulatus]
MPREIFAHQPNRNFIRSLILTQSTARLVHCDHTGTYLTPPINIHDRPHTFIRLILGLSSANESILGFDVSIQWTIHPVSGNKGVGTIEALDEENVMTSYTLGANEPPFIQAILGRGTTCWCATHPVNGERVVIKDSWRPDSRRSEGEFLDAARGIDGVVQVISYQDRCAETKDYRPSFTGETSFENRVKSRAVLKRYGECIDHFTSRFQAIAAFRDVIVGKRGIFHKDISIQNILFGAPGAAPGSRGILIDLGMANWLSSPIEELRVNAFMGTRRFQSIAVLLSANTSCYPPYDHLDDLESLFYVLCDLVLLFEKPGGKILDSVNLNEVWDNPLPAAGAIAKSLSIFHSVFIKASDFWGGLCERLVVGFKDILRPAVEKKFMIRKPPPRRLVVGGEEKYERLVEVGREWSCVEMLVWESDQAFRRYTSCD